jgi:hypothetical protein
MYFVKVKLPVVWKMAIKVYYSGFDENLTSCLVFTLQTRAKTRQKLGRPFQRAYFEHNVIPAPVFFI